jgi:hypothetical protein
MDERESASIDLSILQAPDMPPYPAGVEVHKHVAENVDIIKVPKAGVVMAVDLHDQFADVWLTDQPEDVLTFNYVQMSALIKLLDAGLTQIGAFALRQEFANPFDGEVD